MRSPDPVRGEYGSELRAELLGIARTSIVHGLESGQFCLPLGEPGSAGWEQRASFVTLTREGRLRGCVGALEAVRPLAVDVARAAYLAAFEDPRFPPLAAVELAATVVEISVLTPLERLAARTERELLAALCPGVDGLLFEAGGRRATFLPKVWEDLPDPVRFLAELRRKAGLPADYWSASVVVHRYRTETFAEASAD